MTPVTASVAANVTDLRSLEIAVIRLNFGSEAPSFTIIMSSTFKDPNVFPAHVNMFDPFIETSSPSPRFGINFCW